MEFPDGEILNERWTLFGVMAKCLFGLPWSDAGSE
jgi:hypothetical protein